MKGVDDLLLLVERSFHSFQLADHESSLFLANLVVSSLEGGEMGVRRNRSADEKLLLLLSLSLSASSLSSPQASLARIEESRGQWNRPGDSSEAPTSGPRNGARNGGWLPPSLAHLAALAATRAGEPATVEVLLGSTVQQQRERERDRARGAAGRRTGHAPPFPAAHPSTSYHCTCHACASLLGGAPCACGGLLNAGDEVPLSVTLSLPLAAWWQRWAGNQEAPLDDGFDGVPGGAAGLSLLAAARQRLGSPAAATAAWRAVLRRNPFEYSAHRALCQLGEGDADTAFALSGRGGAAMQVRSAGVAATPAAGAPPTPAHANPARILSFEPDTPSTPAAPASRSPPSSTSPTTRGRVRSSRRQTPAPTPMGVDERSRGATGGDRPRSKGVRVVVRRFKSPPTSSSAARDRPAAGIGNETPAVQEAAQPSQPAAAAAAAAAMSLPPCAPVDVTRRALALLHALGTADAALGRFDALASLDALDQLPLALAMSPQADLRRGRAYYELARYSEAAKAFELVRRATGGWSVEGADYHSTCLWHLRASADLVALGAQLLSVDRQAAETWTALGNALSLAQRHAEAVRHFERAAACAPTRAYPRALAGHEHAANGDDAAASVSFRLALRLNPRQYTAWYGLGLAAQRAGRLPEAAASFGRAASLAPQSTVARCFLGMVLASVGDVDGARTAFDRAVSLSGGSNTLARFQRAQLAVRDNAPKGPELLEAVRELEYLVDLLPTEAAVHFALGAGYVKMEQHSRALRHFTVATDLDPSAAELVAPLLAECEDRLAEQDGEDAASVSGRDDHDGIDLDDDLDDEMGDL